MDNRAELALAAGLLEAIQQAIGNGIDRATVVGRVKSKVSSADVRWRHAYYPERVADQLRLHQIIGRKFSRSRPRSAVSIVKQGACLRARLQAREMSSRGGKSARRC